MRLGIFMMPVHPPARSFTDTLAEDEEKALYADALGFDELWLGEHFSATTEPIPSPLMFMASLVPRTKNSEFRHRRDLSAEPRSRHRRRRGRAVRSHEPRPLHVWHRAGRAALRFRAVRQCRPQRPRPQGDGSHCDYRAHLGAGSALRSARRISRGADQRRDHSASRHRHDAKAVPEGRTADHHVGVEPQFGDGARRRPSRLGDFVRQ